MLDARLPCRCWVGPLSNETCISSASFAHQIVHANNFSSGAEKNEDPFSVAVVCRLMGIPTSFKESFLAIPLQEYLYILVVLWAWSALYISYLSPYALPTILASFIDTRFSSVLYRGIRRNLMIMVAAFSQIQENKHFVRRCILLHALEPNSFQCFDKSP
jgi:hypothetical protein